MIAIGGSATTFGAGRSLGAGLNEGTLVEVPGTGEVPRSTARLHCRVALPLIHESYQVWEVETRCPSF